MGLLLESMGKYWNLASTHLQAGSPSPVGEGEGGGARRFELHSCTKRERAAAGVSSPGK